MRDFTVSIINVIGGRATEYEEELINTRAEKIGANAIRGVKQYYETINSMLMVIASGTAVVIEE